MPRSLANWVLIAFALLVSGGGNSIAATGLPPAPATIWLPTAPAVIYLPAAPAVIGLPEPSRLNAGFLVRLPDGTIYFSSESDRAE